MLRYAVLGHPSPGVTSVFTYGLHDLLQHSTFQLFMLPISKGIYKPPYSSLRSGILNIRSLMRAV